MADFVLNGGSTVARTLANLQHGVVTHLGALTVEGDAVTASAASKLNVFGTLTSESFGASLNAVDFDGSSFRMTIGASGSVAADGDAISAMGSARILINNFGTVASSSDAIDIRQSDGHLTIEVSNHGDLAGAGAGLIVDSGSLNTDVLNTGNIFGTDFGIRVSPFTDNTGAVRLFNSGEIAGSTSEAYSGGEGIDEITNSGLMSGDVLLGDGDDVYRGDGGQVAGKIDGGSGKDNLRGGDLDDDLRGANGADKLAGRGGEDVLTGGNGADDLRGNRGDDDIKGGKDADRINGGRDDDILTGGGGADRFVFNRNAGDDTITDFNNGSDKIDLSAFGFRNAQFNGQIDPALSNAGGGATFLDLDELGGEGSVLIEGLAFAQAGAGDFIL